MKVRCLSLRTSPPCTHMANLAGSENFYFTFIIDQAGLELTQIYLPLLPCVLGLKVCTTTHNAQSHTVLKSNVWFVVKKEISVCVYSVCMCVYSVCLCRMCVCACVRVSARMCHRECVQAGCQPQLWVLIYCPL